MNQPPENAAKGGDTFPSPKPEAPSFISGIFPRGVLCVILLLFFGAMFWAKTQDPFSRKWFSLKTADGSSFKCVVVRPKPLRQCPVVVFAHGSGGSLMNDGADLRQMAEMGLAVVSLEYTQTNGIQFEAQFDALLQYLAGQSWANTNAIAWVGFSLGANLTMDFACRHAERPPNLLIQLSGAGLTQGRANFSFSSLHCPVLLIQGDQDDLFPVGDTRHLAAQFQSNGVPVTLWVIAGAPHGMEPNRGVVFRGIGEFCLVHFSGKDAWRHYYSMAQWQAEAPILWVFWIPAMGAGLLLFFWHPWVARSFRLAGRAASQAGGLANPASRSLAEIALRVLAGLLAAWALAETCLHLVPPHLPVNATSLRLARQFLVQSKARADFDFLAGQPGWQKERLKSLLDHVELAEYNRELINWQVDDQKYRDNVLSPVITGHPGELMNWRRPLWEEFYPRIRKEASLPDAVPMVLRHLRERVTVAGLPGLSHEVREIWQKQITDETGFNIIYVAALRSVGVPARLNARSQAEFWDGAVWQTAPGSWLASW